MAKRLRVTIETQAGQTGDLFITPAAVTSIEDRAPGRCYVSVGTAGTGFPVPMSAADFATACDLAEDA